MLVLERGRRWDKTNFPRKPEDAWLWNHDRPETENGWLDLRLFPGMSVAAGAAVGGGSHIYANISCKAPPAVFEQGWCPEITYQDLKPRYDAVAAFMDVQQVPDTQWTGRMKLMRDGAVATGNADRFKKLDLAVSFDPKWTYENDYAKGEQGSTSLHQQARRTAGNLHPPGKLRYRLRRAGQEYPRPKLPLRGRESVPRRCAPAAPGRSDRATSDGTYRVSYDSLETGRRVPGSETARIVIVAAGSMGSTELLLRARNLYKTLPRISPTLGLHWSGNGDFLTPAFYAFRDVEASKGPDDSLGHRF